MGGVNPPRSTRGLVVALSVIGAGVIHLAAIRSHIGSPAAVASFTGIGLIQILLGASLLQPGALRTKRLAVIGVAAVALGAWAVSRMWGLPAVSGHAGPEAVGPVDLAAVALQLVSLLLVSLPVRAPQPSGQRRTVGALMTLPIVAVSVVASFSLLSVPPHGHGHPAAPAAEARVASHVEGSPLVKRAVPVPAVAPAASSHVDAAGAPAHGH